MRLVFLGSGEFGLPTLAALHATHQIVGVVSQPPRPAGRQRKLTPTPIAQWALAQGLPLLEPEDVNQPDVLETIARWRAEASVVIAFGQKLAPALLDVLGQLTVNLHASLLPKYRGAAPINWALIQGETVTGVSVIGIAQRMDAGDIYAAAELTIDPLETAGELHDRLAQLGPAVMQRTLDDLAQGQLSPQAQDETQATRAPKLSRADSPLDLSLPVTALRQRIHGLTPWPGVTARLSRAGHEPLELKLLRVRDHAFPAPADPPTPGLFVSPERLVVSGGELELLEVQPPGKRPMPMTDFLRGHPIRRGDQLTAP